MFTQRERIGNKGRASLIIQLVKNPPAMQETPVRFLGREDPLEKGKATHSSISGLENSMDCIVHGVTKSRTQLSDFHLLAAAAKSLQSCPTLCDPIDGSPPGFPIPGIPQARTLEWIAIVSS